MLNVHLLTLNGETIYSILAFDQQFLLCNADEERFQIFSSKNIIAVNKDNYYERFLLSDIAQREDVFIYLDNKMIFHSVDNGASVIELLFFANMAGQRIGFDEPAMKGFAQNIMLTELISRSANMN